MLPQTSILDMFGRSPIRLLQHCIKKIYNCVELLPYFFEALITQDWKQASSVHQNIIQFEKEADELKRAFRRRHLPKSLLILVPRGDFPSFLDKQDKIANTAKDIVGIMIGRQMEIPSPLITKFKNFLNHWVKASEQAQEAINELDELLASGFPRKQTDDVDKLIEQLNNTEYQTNKLQTKVRQSLFQIKNTLAPVNVIFLHNIIEQIGFLSNHAQQTGNHLQLLTEG